LYIAVFMRPLFSIFCLIFLCKWAQAQQVVYTTLTNPSFEGGARGAGICPPDWTEFKNVATTEPVSRLSRDATDGDNYLSMPYTDPQTTTSVGQRLKKPLYPGRTYTISFDLSTPRENMKQFVAGAITIGGTPERGNAGEEFWKSGSLEFIGWQRFSVTFTPKILVNYLVFQASPGTLYVPRDTTAAPIYVVHIDNLSPIYESFPLESSAQAACPGAKDGSVTITPLFTQDQYTYLWQPGGYTSASVYGLPTGPYEVTVTNQLGTVAKQSVIVPTSTLNFETTVTDAKCGLQASGSITIKPEGGMLPYTYDEYENLFAGTYEVLVKDAHGCSVRKNVKVNEPTPLDLEVTGQNIPCSDATEGLAIVRPIGGTPPFRYYGFGYAGESMAEQNENVFKLKEGVYAVFVVDINRCQLGRDVTISKTWQPCAVYVPSAFSPNGDGINDTFKAHVLDGVSDYRLAVFGRWGQVLFETRNTESTWDGKVNGVLLPAGSYIYSITYNDHNNQPMKQQGNLTLLR
jgi:gliding motility-associated-like protein